MNKYFFYSYARLDRDQDKSESIKTFYEDLVEEVRLQTGLSKEKIGFFDTEDIEPGLDWPETLTEALLTCRVFIPVYSPTYFIREHCGREWYVFNTRLNNYMSQTTVGTKRPPLILPIMLVAPRGSFSLPEPVADIQYINDDYPEVYRQEGLKYLKRLKKFRDDYELLIKVFAEKLIKAAESYPIPQGNSLPPLQEIESPFQTPQSNDAAQSCHSEISGPRIVHFFFVAGHRKELQEVRTTVDSYGDEGGWDWKPYLPSCTEEVAYLTQGIAYSEKLISKIVTIDQDIIQQLKEARKKKNIVAIIVDAWSIYLARYATWVHPYDEYDAYNCVMLIAANNEDDETKDKLLHLKENINSLFDIKVRRKDSDLFLYPIGYCEEFKQKLGIALRRIQMDFIKKSQNAKEAIGNEVIAKPTISGPGGNQSDGS